MAITHNNVDSLTTRFTQSFVNLTQANSTKYPATSAIRIDTRLNPPLTAVEIYDQWAFRVLSLSATT